MAGAGLLAYILASKFDDHLPLYRLNEIFARMGADIPDSTLVDWCGRAMKVLAPLIERIEADVMTSDLLHADDTPIRVLDRVGRDKGLGKGVKKGRIWAYVRDQRPWSGASPPGAVYAFAPDWKEEHVHRHLARTYGAIISVYTGPDDTVTALTDDGIDELKDMLRDARITTETWHAFLDDLVDDTELVARIKAQSLR